MRATDLLKATGWRLVRLVVSVVLWVGAVEWCVVAYYLVAVAAAATLHSRLGGPSTQDLIEGLRPLGQLWAGMMAGVGVMAVVSALVLPRSDTWPSLGVGAVFGGAAVLYLPDLGQDLLQWLLAAQKLAPSM